MIVLIAKSVVTEKNQAAFLQLGKKLVEETRKETGCIFYDLVRDVNEAGVFYFVEKYVDQAALDAHTGSDYFKTYVPQLQPLREDSQLSRCEIVSFE